MEGGSFMSDVVNFEELRQIVGAGTSAVVDVKADLHRALAEIEWGTNQRPAATVTEPDRNLSAEEAAQRLGMSRDYLYRHAANLPFTVRIGSRVLFSERGLERWNARKGGK